MKKAVWIIPFMLLSVAAMGQFNIGFALRNEVPVLVNGDTLPLAWVGGMNNPQYSAVDLDSTLDGVADLFTFDRDGMVRRTFVYNTARERYEWWPEGARLFPRTHNAFCVLTDYNGDGKPDLFTSTNQGSQSKILVYKNTADEQLSFELAHPGLRYRIPGSSGYPYMLPLFNNTPIFDDVDEDGDLDVMYLITLTTCPAYALFANQSMEDYGVPDSLEFRVAEKCWGKVQLLDAYEFREWDCDTACNFTARENKDVVHNQTLFDINGDGLKDMLISYTHHHQLAALYNTGSNADGYFDQSLTDATFPSSDVSVNLENQPMPYFIDVDHDGYTDMLVANNMLNTASTFEADTSNTRRFDLYYRNTSTSGTPNFQLSTGSFSEQMIDLGIMSYPAVGDLNGDGLPDLLVGTVGYRTINGLASSFGHLELFLNVGSETAPAFSLVDDDYLNLGQYEWGLVHPALGDLDADGDLDLMIGADDGHLHYFRNAGFPQQANFILFSSGVQFQGIDVGQNAHPSFYDLNEDGLLDLVVGDEGGRVQYFENDGTASAPDFDSSPTIEKLGNLMLYQSYGGNAVPCFSRKIDSVNNLYLLIGTREGTMLVCGPIADFTAPYSINDSIVVEAEETAPVGADLDGDGRIELILGQRSGGLNYLRRTSNTEVGSPALARVSRVISIIPNPATDRVTIEVKGVADTRHTVRITDLLGRTILSAEAVATNGVVRMELNVSQLPSGPYAIVVDEESSELLLID